jgi:hypothetical protein
MPAAAELGPDDKKAAVQGVLQTASFLRAEQLRQFLRFICEMEMAGRAGEITEYLIGVEALGRSPGYSTAEDSIVRRRAIDLREKLDEVYATELAAARVRIELPKGRYVPHFVVVEPAPNGGVAPAGAPQPAPPLSRAASRPFLLGFLSGALAASAAFVVVRRVTTPPPPPARPAELGIVHEGEARGNTLHGSTTIGECLGCSGGARVRNIGNSPTNYVVVNDVMAGADGNYTLKVDYYLQGRRSFFLSVNGGPPVELSLEADSWNQPSSAALSVPLKAGPNSLKFGNDTMYAPDLDRIVVR